MNVLIYIIYGFLSFILSSFVHEMGHIVTGLILGEKFNFIIFGPIGLFRQNTGIKVQFIKKFSWWGGVSLSSFSENKLKQEKNINKIYRRKILGGPIFSIISGLIILFTFRSNYLFAIMFGFTSIAMGISTLIPLYSEGSWSDGGKYLRLRKESTRSVEEAIIRIGSTLAGGVYDKTKDSYQNLNIKDIEVLLNSKEIETLYYGLLIAYHYYKSFDDINKCQKIIERQQQLNLKVKKESRKLYDIEQL